MRRLGSVLAIVILVTVAAVTPTAALAASAPPVPTPSRAPTASPGPTASSAPTASGDSPTVCLNTANTVAAGLQNFVGDMRKVSSQAGSGDLSGAQQSVQEAGTTMTGTAGQLRETARPAQDAQLKTAVTDLAGEFDRLGKSLTDLAALQHFDTAKLTTLADRVGTLCGGPGSSPGGPGSGPGSGVPGSGVPAPGMTA